MILIMKRAKYYRQKGNIRYVYPSYKKNSDEKVDWRTNRNGYCMTDNKTLIHKFLRVFVKDKIKSKQDIYDTWTAIELFWSMINNNQLNNIIC